MPEIRDNITTEITEREAEQLVSAGAIYECLEAGCGPGVYHVTPDMEDEHDALEGIFKMLRRDS